MTSKRGRAEPTTSSNAPNASQQSVDEDTKVIKNSPYGNQRSSYGWGTIFKPCKPLVFLPELPNIHIGLSSLNAVPAVKKSDRGFDKLLPQYRKKFEILEHCYPSHRLCEIEQWENWYRTGGTKRFLYTIKANQYLTHTRMLDIDDDTRDHIDSFFAKRCALLKERLGAVLIQLPPMFHKTAAHMERIRGVAELIPKGINIAVEFRHSSWYNQEVYNLLREVKWTLVSSHNEDIGEAPVVDTGTDILYVRLHGAVGMYVGDYGPDLMKRWADIVAKFVAEKPLTRRVFFMMNNNESHVQNLHSSIVDATCFYEKLLESLEAVGLLATTAKKTSDPATATATATATSAASNADLFVSAAEAVGTTKTSPPAAKAAAKAAAASSSSQSPKTTPPTDSNDKNKKNRADGETPTSAKSKTTKVTVVVESASIEEHDVTTVD